MTISRSGGSYSRISPRVSRQRAALLLCRRYLRRMEELSNAWRENPSDRTLHRFRIGIRQCRVLLRVVRKDADEHGGRALRNRLKHAVSHLGRVRDMDVILAQIKKSKTGRKAKGKAKLAPLTAEVVRDRDVKLNRTRRYLRGAAWDRIMKASRKFLARWARELECYDPQTIKEFLDQEFEKHRRLIARRTGMARAKESETLHEFRIRLRRIRYLGDLFERLEDDEQRGLLKKIRKCEQLLGNIHDIDIAWAFFSRHAGLLPEAFAGELLVAREEKLAKFRQKWPKCRKNIR